MAQFTLTAQMDARNRVLCSPDTEMKRIMLEAFRLLDYDPSICKHIEEDLNRVALAAKKKRIVASVERRAATPPLNGMAVFTVEDAVAIEPDELQLGVGRERLLDGEAALMLAMCRAHLDSLSSKQAVDRIRDSLTMKAYFEGRGLSLPCRSVMHEWVNCISEECYEHILDIHLWMVRGEGLDDFTAVTADSFSVWANTSWPTDSAMILGLVSRAWHYSSKLAGFGLPGFSEAYIRQWLERIRTLDREISFACGKPNSKRKIRRLYHRLCNRGDLVLQRLDRQIPSLLPTWQAGVAKLPVFTRERVQAVVERILCDLSDAARVVAYARQRVLEGKSVPCSEKILSLSDRSAAYIKKGGREPVIGYKPQVMRSSNGFISAFELQTGNPNDAARLVPLTDQHILRTGVVPWVVSVDDGYSSKANREALQERTVRTISMNGATGKRITPEQQWDSPAYEQARNKRSAVESLVFTIRFNFHLYRFSRRGSAATRAEMYEKVIAHNFWRAALLRDRKAAETVVELPRAG